MKKIMVLVLLALLLCSVFLFTACEEKEPCRDFGGVCKEMCVDKDFHIENAYCEEGMCCYTPLK